MGDTGAYSKKADDYARYRLAYSADAISSLIDITGLDSTWVVADMGSGTGRVAEHLVDHAGKVYGIEPNLAMREKAESIFRGHPAFVSVAATAEDTTLPDGSVDLITMGQALHWFDRPRMEVEYARILREPGWTAVICNRTGSEPCRPIEDLFAPDGFSHRCFPVSVTETWEEYLGGLRSAAGAPDPGDSKYDGFVREQRALFDSRAVDGLITIDYTTELSVGHLGRMQ